MGDNSRVSTDRVQIAAWVPRATRNQLRQLAALLGSQGRVITTAIERLHHSDYDPDGADPAELYFWRNVATGSSIECWEWTAGTSGNGYGVTRSLTEDGKQEYAHRVSWQLHFGPIPDDRIVCHHCDNPPCVNPKHLYLGTISDNAIDMTARGRRYNCGKHTRGECSNAGKLTTSQVLEIRQGADTGEFTITQLAAKYGVSATTIKNIKYRHAWAWLADE